MTKIDNETTRQRLEKWLPAKLSGGQEVTLGELTRPGGAGFSAEMFFTTARYQTQGDEQTKNLVVRRQIFGHDLLLDANLEQQWRVMKAFREHTAIPVPPLVGIELDHDVLGAPFLVMEQVPGRVVPQNPNYNLKGWLVDLPLEKRHLVWRHGIEAIADIHRVDWRQGFSFLATPGAGQPGLDQYLDWMARWLAWAVDGRSWPVLEQAMDYLRNNQPSNAPVSVLWGDPIPANTIYDEDLRVSSVIDWEMAALGPGEIDLAWWLYFDSLFSEGFGIKRLEGLPDRAESIAIFEARLGRPVQNMDYYDVLATLRMGIVSVRQVDRQIAMGNLAADNRSHTHNPTAALLARLIGVEPPPVGEDYRALIDVLMNNGH